ncbi:hypothetical protein B296_00035026 [Ensete ventricosum]|uniref:Uncharacterized protein n=1 Tax=Ensete ventricosum TaxID=4639 RepID=A0A426XNC0_ENSVE|nr:hypothetical protein B296_00035026 [Ensete ventricosum]
MWQLESEKLGHDRCSYRRKMWRGVKERWGREAEMGDDNNGGSGDTSTAVVPRTAPFVANTVLRGEGGRERQAVKGGERFPSFLICLLFCGVLGFRLRSISLESMARKRKTEATRLDEVDRTLYSTFCSAANSLSQLYTQAMNQQKISFQAGERHAMVSSFLTVPLTSLSRVPSLCPLPLLSIVSSVDVF